jgi:site-specific recombinase XerC
MNNPLATLTDQFLKERTYLKNVTPATLVWYRVAFKSYCASFANNTAPVPTKAALQEFVVKQREHGLRPVTVNTYIGAMNAFCVWLHVEGHVVERIKLPKLRVEKGIRISR